MFERIPPQTRSKLQENLAKLAEIDQIAHAGYQAMARGDAGLIFDPSDPAVPINLRIGYGLLYPGDARQFAKEHVAFHLQHIQPFVMPVLLFFDDDTIPFRHAIALDEETGQSVIRKPILERYRGSRFCPTLFIFGLGLSYSIDLILAELDVCNIILVETNADLISAFLASCDLEALVDLTRSRGGQLHFAFHPDPLTVLRLVFDRASMLPDAHINYFQPFISHRLPGMDLVIDHFGKNAPHILSGVFGYFHDECRQILQTYKNLGTVSGLLCNQHPVIENATAIVVGSGPSLDKTIDAIKSLAGRTFIIACGTAMLPLLKVGIVPDAYIELETSPINLDYMALIHQFTLSQDTLFFGASGIPQEVANKWTHNYLFLRDRSTSTVFFPNDCRPIRQSWPLVGNAGLSIAVALGFRQIILAGLDCGKRRGERHHSVLSAYYDGSEEKILENNPDTSLDYTSEEARKSATDREEMARYELPSVLGDSVWADSNLRFSHQYLEFCIRETPGIKVWQVSEGAAIKFAENVPPDQFDPRSIAANPHGIREIILSRIHKINDVQNIYGASFKDASTRSQVIIDAVKRDFTGVVTNIGDWMTMIGQARKTLINLAPKMGPELGLLDISLQKTTRAFTERALMIQSPDQQTAFLQAAARRVCKVLEDMGQHMKTIAGQMTNSK
jgi:hypothetical protein